jgi:signal transduction histidine kinase
MRYDRFDLQEIILNLFNVLASQANIRSNFFVLKIKPDFPKEVVSDPNMITQVLLNLLMNSNKFSSEGEI